MLKAHVHALAEERRDGRGVDGLHINLEQAFERAHPLRIARVHRHAPAAANRHHAAGQLIFAGRLLAHSIVNPDADKWDVLTIPALLDEKSADLLTRISHDPRYRKYLQGDPITFIEGDSYAPRRFPLKDLLRSKANMSARAWSALYMQNPTPDDGDYFKAALRLLAKRPG